MPLVAARDGRSMTMEPARTYSVINLYMFTYCVLGVVNMILWMVFRDGVQKHSSSSGMSIDQQVTRNRYGLRALAGAEDVTGVGLRVLRTLLLTFVVIMFLGFCGAAYLVFCPITRTGVTK